MVDRVLKSFDVVKSGATVAASGDTPAKKKERLAACTSISEGICSTAMRYAEMPPCAFIWLDFSWAEDAMVIVKASILLCALPSCSDALHPHEHPCPLSQRHPGVPETPLCRIGGTLGWLQ